MRIGFVTCVELGLSCMEAIYEAGGSLSFAATLRDDLATAKSGRVYLDDFCRSRHIPLFKLRNINDPDAVEAIRAAQLDWLMIIGWSQIARQAVLEAPRLGVLGMHPSLLPVGRGRAAVPWAILLGLPVTGVTLFKLDGGVDTGPILAQERIELAPRETATSLYRRVNEAHRSLILAHWAAIEAGNVQLAAQDSAAATVWVGRTPEQGRLDPSMSVVDADRLVRAVTRPYPGAFVEKEGRRLRIWSAEPIMRRPDTSVSGPDLLEFCDGYLRPIECEWENAPAVTSP
jgi:methionyl-tRNA formyltransferase